ncbi:hypothetical protein HPB51_021870 [Rhipicephalus microplus]|uniref:Tick transposon n=1 Tax=Rhipicephalus microplus TaxID=6941 RepID=A0A9J6EJI4_RHIMP|nr:hypothetical protein HPB51_021870 [Rhipicephalus microplus]
MLSRSWADVKKETIQNCFRHACFRMSGDDTPISDSTEDAAGVSAEVWNELAEFPGAIDGSMFEEFVSADDDVPIMGQLQDEGYIADVVPTTSHSDSNMEIDDGPLPISSEVISALVLVWRYCLNVEGCGLSCSDSLDNLKAVLKQMYLLPPHPLLVCPPLM